MFKNKYVPHFIVINVGVLFCLASCNKVNIVSLYLFRFFLYLFQYDA